MITNFRHKVLRQFYESGSKAGIQAQHAERLRLILARLDASREPRDMNLPGLRLHPMSGDLAGLWSVSVSGTGGWSSALTGKTPATSIIWTTTKRGAQP